MELMSEMLKLYLEKCCEAEPKLLQKINRETNLKVLMPRMLSGHYQGRVLSMISKLICPKNILEIGTFTGYATLCLAEGLAKDGKIITIDINEELEERVRGYFTEAGCQNSIDYRIGDALNIIPQLENEFDLVFIDADKKNNYTYFKLILDKIRSGGVIIVDNVLWSGKVIDKISDNDTANIDEFNKLIGNDDRIEKLILPVRDGLFIIRKK